MKKTTNRSLCASMAISAVLALGSTPAMAQSASASQPDVPPPAEITSPMVLSSAAPAAGSGDINAITAHETAALPDTKSLAAPDHPIMATTTAKSPPPKLQSAKPIARPVPPAGAVIERPQASAAVAATPTAALINKPTPVASAVPAKTGARLSRPVDPAGPDALWAALAGIAVVGGALTLARRRRDPDVEGDDAVAAYDLPVAPVPDVETVAPTPAQYPSTSAIPQGAVPTGEKRNELIAAMAAAKPDAANPFTSARARRHRARLILQARECQQRQSAPQPFDWRSYGSLSPSGSPKTTRELVPA